MYKLNSLTKLIFLSILIAIGFLNIVLSCALFQNWLPLFVVGIFLLAPIPNSISQTISNSYESDFLSDSSTDSFSPIKEFLKFMTGFLVFSGSLLPVVLYHSHLICFWSLVLSLSGGFIIYLSIVLFSVSFKNDDDYDDYDF
ncbi:hypothetical protein CANARDRAFT_6372 [[Candida] arabinofermentans NRRL YB-2248]|uniref:Vacuolar protein sorting-associated protein 55 n=1 Tax=[Candida] arabinofermentans NRRL YB-2248 TaxID=983967 RepID=A0A1E4T4X7_9ASCO|nr:hypothetical protein CANARDRAFT_6372 [[Candida] arabinofermentans NRRL YB-2248]